jgi:hypothetical protein
VVEQAEVLLAPSVAVAWKVVIELSGTDAVIPGEANTESEPLGTVPMLEQLVVPFELLYSFTVVPAGAEPNIFGELLFAGEPGALPVSVGAAGSVEFSM